MRKRARSTFLLLICVCLVAACASPRTAPPGERPGAVEITSRYVVTADGLALPLRQWTPENGEGASAVILALHGFNDYSGAFREAGPALAAGGAHVYAYDQRGFGGGPNRGLWAGADAMKLDAIQIARVVKALHPGKPFYLMGLSMGGAVAMLALADAPDLATGAILVGPAVRGRQTAPKWQLWGLDLAAATIPWYTATGQGLRIQPTDNIGELRRMFRDPNVIKAPRIDALQGLVDLMTLAAASADQQTTPLLLLYGMKDDLVPKGPTLDVLQAMANPPASRPQHRLAVYQDGYHMLLRDLKNDRVFDDILAWIASPEAPLPSAADAQAQARLAAAADR